MSAGKATVATAMSAVPKRSRPRPAGVRSGSPRPSSKRLKSSHPSVAASSLASLVDEKARVGRKLTANPTKVVGKPAAHRIDESHTLAAYGCAEAVAPRDNQGETDGLQKQKQKQEQEQEDVISISSGSDSSELEEDNESGENGHERDTNDDSPGSGSGGLSNGSASIGKGEAAAAVAGADVSMVDDTEPTDEATFGDMLQALHPGTMDLHKASQHEQRGSPALMPVDGGQLMVAPTAASLGTVLTQALKTNDADLLESCFAMTDVNAIRATIQRQKSTHVSTLLQRIAERIHKRPGRAGRLMIWVQWILVTHGGFLAHQPELMRDLRALSQVTRERANGLQPLLHLKGKLDLLSAQLEARRSMQARSRATHLPDSGHEHDVFYIEGHEGTWSSDDEDAAESGSVVKMGRPGTAALSLAGVEEGVGVGEGEVHNGFINGIEEDTSADEDEERDGGGSVDGEAEEASSEDDNGEDEEAQSDDAPSEESDEDEEESSEGDEEMGKQAPPQTLHRKR